jgi:hypothetical protein
MPLIEMQVQPTLSVRYYLERQMNLESKIFQHNLYTQFDRFIDGSPPAQWCRPNDPAMPAIQTTVLCRVVLSNE